MSKSELDQGLRRRLKARFGDFRKSPDSLDVLSSRELPLISGETKDEILQRFNLVPPKTWEPSNGPWYPAFTAAMQIAGEEFAILYKDAGNFMNATAGWVTRNYENPDQGNCASMGIALVLKAFHLQAGPNFIDQLATLNVKALMTQYDLTGRTDERRSIILQSHSPITIPPFQFNLKYCVDKLAAYSPDPLAVSDGANAVYNALGKCWGK